MKTLDLILERLETIDRRLSVLEANSTLVCRAYAQYGTRITALEQAVYGTPTPTPLPIEAQER